MSPRVRAHVATAHVLTAHLLMAHVLMAHVLMARAVSLACVSGVTFCALAAPAYGSGTFETWGPSARARAMANAVVALDDPAAAHTNPAAVARSGRSPMLSAGLMLDVPALDVTLEAPRAPDDPLAPSTPPTVAGISASLLMPIEVLLGGRVVLGAAGYAPTSALLRARLHDPQRPFFYLYDSSTERFDASLAAGLRVAEWLYLGLGARLGGSQTGVVSLAVDPVRGRVTEQTLDAAVLPSAALTAGLLLGRLGLPGVLQASVGLVYREPTAFQIALPAGLSIEGAEVDALLEVHVLAGHAPRSLTAGIAIDALSRVTGNLEVQGAQWSEAPPPFMRTRVDLGGSGLDALGLGDGLDAPGDGQERVVSPGFVDTLSWRLGLEVNALPGILVLRGGYHFRPTPVPDQTSGTNIIDSDAHILAAGAGVALGMPRVLARPMSVDVAYQVHLLNERNAAKRSPVDAVGGWIAGGSVHGLSVACTYAW